MIETRTPARLEEFLGAMKRHADPGAEELARLARLWPAAHEAAMASLAAMPGIGVLSMARRERAFLSIAAMLDARVGAGRLSQEQAQLALTILRMGSRRYAKAEAAFVARLGRRDSADLAPARDGAALPPRPEAFARPRGGGAGALKGASDGCTAGVEAPPPVRCRSLRRHATPRAAEVEVDRASASRVMKEMRAKPPAGHAATAGKEPPAVPGPGPRSSPLYQQVKQHLVQRVLAGEWRPSELLPSEMKLAQEYNLSQGTVRKALEEMAQEGLVSRQAGRGTFVTSHSGSYRPFRFHRLYDKSGQRLAGEAVTFVHVRKQRVGARAGAGLGLAAGAWGTECVRLRPLAGRPVLLEQIVLPARLFPDIGPLLEREKPPSIYLLLEQHYNTLVTRVVERVRARAATEQEVELLELAPATPMLEVERVAYSLGGEPVEWRIMAGETAEIHYLNAMG